MNNQPTVPSPPAALAGPAMDRPSVAVVGAGLSGLTAAYRLTQAGWAVTVLEADDHVGGRVQTVERDGYLMDTGATGIAESYTAYLSLIDELGLGADIVAASPVIGILRDGRVRHLDMAHLVTSGVGTDLLSPLAKLRCGRLVWDVGRAKLKGQLDYNDMRKAAPIDTTSARDYATRVLGEDAAAYLTEVIVRTMLIADAGDVSVVEFFSGLANIFTSKICSLRGGQGRLPRLLAERLEDVRLGARVEAVTDCGDHVMLRWRAGEETLEQRRDAVVVATPLPVAAEICPDRGDVLDELNAAMGYTSCISVAVATHAPTRSPALVIGTSPREDDTVALMFLNHNKSADRVPPGGGLIECCWENHAAQGAMNLSDEEIVARTLRSVVRICPEVAGKVAFTHVTRWPAALPHTSIGAYRLIGELNARIDPSSRIQFAADYMSAAGQNTCVEFGTRAATALTEAHSTIA